MTALLSVPVNGWHVTVAEVRTLELLGRPIAPFPAVLAADYPLKRHIRK